MNDKKTEIKKKEFEYNSILPVYFKQMTIHEINNQNIRKVEVVNSKLHETNFHLSKNFYKQICTINLDE